MLTEKKKRLEDLASEIADMNYTDFTKGEDYSSLVKRYRQAGQRAMDDTIGQVSARTGGIASSYATAAGNQAYNEHMSKLEDTARAMYDDQRQEKIDNFNVQRSLYDIGYQATRDRAADYKWNVDGVTEQERWNQSRADDLLDREISSLGNELYYAPDAYGSYEAYKKANPDSKITEAQYNQILNTSKGEYTEANKADEEERLWNNAIIMWTTGNEVDAETIKALGLTPAQAAAYASYYQAQNQPKLDLSLNQVTEQLEGGNFNASLISAYATHTGESYAAALIRTGGINEMTSDEMTRLAKSYESLGDEKTAKEIESIRDTYYGNAETNGARKLKDATFEAVKNGAANGGGGINRDAIVRDTGTGKEYSLAGLIQKLVDDGSFDNKSQARAWIRAHQEDWGVNTKVFSRGY